jgi:hypothetical protein
LDKYVKVAEKVGLPKTSIEQTVPKVSTRPGGENSPNLATLNLKL